MMNTATSTGTRSAIGRLLDMLLKHGTLPNTPTPEIITNAQTELAALEMTIEMQAAELARLREALGIYANPENWKSINGVMVLQTLDHPWNTAKAALEAK